MDFLPGNSYNEWQYLGSGENAIPYQQVTVFSEMKWGDFPVENFVAACGKFSGKVWIHYFTCRSDCTYVEFR